MAESKCIKCNSTYFEVKKANIDKAKFNMFFVQCSNCGGVIGCLEEEDNNYLIKKLALKLGIKL